MSVFVQIWLTLLFLSVYRVSSVIVTRNCIIHLSPDRGREIVM